ncbi:MAG TPA: hypothetical protein DIU37_02640, partial [Opitutae bacterium]|nr:hypothetical protein [Opitutae bacterium]
MSTQVSGFGGNTHWQPWVDQMVDQVYRVNQNRLRGDQRNLNKQIAALGEFETKLESLNGIAKDLQSSELFYSRKVGLADSDSAVLSATAAPKTDLGSYEVTITQLATVSQQKGALDIGDALHTADITHASSETGPLLSAMNLVGELTEGFFTVNGVQVTVSSTDTLQDVFSAIKMATSDDVLGQYSFSTDKITLTSQSSADIVLGSAADTS